jgi:hypothetical protein
MTAMEGIALGWISIKFQEEKNPWIPLAARMLHTFQSPFPLPTPTQQHTWEITGAFRRISKEDRN